MVIDQHEKGGIHTIILKAKKIHKIKNNYNADTYIYQYILDFLRWYFLRWPLVAAGPLVISEKLSVPLHHYWKPIERECTELAWLIEDIKGQPPHGGYSPNVLEQLAKNGNCDISMTCR